MNENTLLLRQIHPDFVQDDRVSSQAFRSTPKDEQRLSVYDGDRIDARTAHEHYTSVLGLRSVGIMAVTLNECNTLDLPVRADPKPFLEHAVIDFSGFGKNATEKKAKQLRAKAVARDWLYRASGAS